jgi:hypothetical protein
LKNYLRCQYCVKNGLKMLIYYSKLRFFGHFCLVLAASPTFFNGLLMRRQSPLMHRLLGITLLLPFTALAAEPAAQAAMPMASSGITGQLLQLLLGLLLVVGLIFLLAWLMRRVQQLGPRGGQVIKIVALRRSVRVIDWCWCRWAASSYFSV